MSNDSNKMHKDPMTLVADWFRRTFSDPQVIALTLALTVWLWPVGSGTGTVRILALPAVQLAFLAVSRLFAGWLAGRPADAAQLQKNLPRALDRLRPWLRPVGSLWFAGVLLMLWLVAMACATVFESMYGTERALDAIYLSWWFQLILVAILILVNAAFAGTEMALVSLREGQLQQLEQRSAAGALVVLVIGHLRYLFGDGYAY